MLELNNAYTRFVSGVMFPLHEAIKGHATTRVLRELEETQWYTPADLRRHQEMRLAELLAHALRSVRYYRDKIPRNMLQDVKAVSIDRLRELPLLTKSLIKANLGDLTAHGAIGLTKSSTGGSMGEPLVFYLDAQRKSYDIAAKWRATRWWEVDIGDPEIVVWGSPVELGAQDRLRSIRDAVFRSKLIAAFDMSEQKLGKIVEKIRRKRPRMLFGYPSAIDHIAAYANAMGHRLNESGIDVVFTTSECLYEHQRERISLTFGCPVANGYGGRDSGFVAHECPDGGMHISADYIIVEILDDAGEVLPPGHAGEITITNLSSSGFPMIRYRTGDIGVLGQSSCTCGRGLPLLSEIQGRTTDLVFASDGTAIHALALIYVVRDLPGIRSFKIVQESLTKTRIMIVPDDDFTSETAEDLRRGCKARLGNDVEIAVTTTDVIQPEASGKHRHVVSHVTSGAAKLHGTGQPRQ